LARRLRLAFLDDKSAQTIYPKVQEWIKKEVAL